MPSACVLMIAVMRHLSVDVWSKNADLWIFVDKVSLSLHFPLCIKILYIYNMNKENELGGTEDAEAAAVAKEARDARHRLLTKAAFNSGRYVFKCWTLFKMLQDTNVLQTIPYHSIPYVNKMPYRTHHLEGQDVIGCPGCLARRERNSAVGIGATFVVSAIVLCGSAVGCQDAPSMTLTDFDNVSCDMLWLSSSELVMKITFPSFPSPSLITWKAQTKQCTNMPRKQPKSSCSKRPKTQEQFLRES